MIHLLLSLFISAAHAQKVGEISPEDQRHVRARVESLRMTHISFGPSFGSDMNNDKMFYSLHLGSHWEPSTNAEIRLNGDFATASEGNGTWLSGSIGGGWIPLRDNFSPVIGAEFGYGYAHIKHASDPAGFMVGGYLGVRFFRTSNAQMSIEYFLQNIMDGVTPTMNGFRVGILF